MNERTPSPIEKFPTEAEVVRMLEHLFEGAGFTETKRVEVDGVLERLVYQGVDSEGDIMLYDYYEGVIDVVFHDNEGIPCGGHDVARFTEGAWKMNI